MLGSGTDATAWPASEADLDDRIFEEDDLNMSKNPQWVIKARCRCSKKLQMWKSASRRLRQMGGVLPGVPTPTSAFD